jgi:hypothetical protein
MEKIPQEIEILQAADIWVLKRTGLGCEAHPLSRREPAKTLDMNWAYDVAFSEIDPKQLGTGKFDDGEDKASQEQLQAEFKADKEKLKGKKDKSRLKAALYI